MRVISNNHLPVLRIYAPEWYQDPEFLAWLDDPERNQATWHRKGQAPNEFSDLLCIWDSGEGSDSDMPERIWQQICDEATSRYGPRGECLLWISNLPEMTECCS